MEEKPKLIFVYNAESGKMNAIKDSIKKIFNKSSYECNLCGITYGAFSMKKDWRDYIRDLDVDVEFLHKDEFRTEYDPNANEFPIAYIKKGSGLETFISQPEMDNFQDIEQLKSTLEERIKNLV